MNRIIHGDTIKVLEKLEENIFDVGVTSPPITNRKNKRDGLLKMLFTIHIKMLCPKEIIKKNR